MKQMVCQGGRWDILNRFHNSRTFASMVNPMPKTLEFKLFLRFYSWESYLTFFSRNEPMGPKKSISTAMCRKYHPWCPFYQQATTENSLLTYITG